MGAAIVARAVAARVSCHVCVGVVLCNGLSLSSQRDGLYGRVFRALFSGKSSVAQNRVVDCLLTRTHCTHAGSWSLSQPLLLDSCNLRDADLHASKLLAAVARCATRPRVKVEQRALLDRLGVACVDLDRLLLRRRCQDERRLDSLRTTDALDSTRAHCE